MASFDRLGFWCSIVASLALVGACAQVTGLSDDYRYDLVDGSADASTANDASSADAARDGSATSDGGERCSAAERAGAQTTIGRSGGDELTAQCRTCLATNCCDEVAECGRQSDCAQSMECIFGCQRNGNKGPCLNGCKQTFSATVGSCIQRFCAAPTCTLQ